MTKKTIKNCSFILLTLFAAASAACDSSPLPKMVKLPPQKIEKIIFKTNLPPREFGEFQYPAKLMNYNKDGYPDLMVQRVRPNNGIYIAKGREGGFEPFLKDLDGFGGFDSEQETLIGDLDGDGFDDLAVQKKNHQVWVALNRGGRLGFIHKPYNAGAGVVDQPTFIGDIKGNGTADIFFHNLFNDVCVSYNDFNNQRDNKNEILYKPHIVLFHIPDESRYYKIALGDADGDKLKDFIVFTGGSDGKLWKSHSIYVFKNENAGRAVAPPYKAALFPAGGFSDEDWPPSVVDANGDGFADVLIHTSDGRVFGALNDGIGNFILTNKSFCCIGGGEWSYYPFQARTFDHNKGAFVCQQKRSEQIIECAYIKF